MQASDPTNAVNSPFSAVAQFKVSKGIDLHTVNVILGPKNIADWENTAQITDARWVPDQLCIFHTRLGVWPGVPFFGDASTLVEGNQWVFAFINGQWWTGAADWYRPSQACKGVGREQHRAGRVLPALAGAAPLVGSAVGRTGRRHVDDARAVAGRRCGRMTSAPMSRSFAGRNRPNVV